MVFRNRGIAYGAALAAMAAAVSLRMLFAPLLGNAVPFITLFVAIGYAAWSRGRGPAIAALLAGGIAAAWFMLRPLADPANQVALLLYALVGGALILMFDIQRTSQRSAAEKSEVLRATLASIGDGVITTDAAARITGMNAVAAALTRWPVEDARGQPLEAVFRIVNEETREPAENPAARALREGAIVALANHTILIARDGTEVHIDDSAAPIRDAAGRVFGCVLTFRGVDAQRRAEELLRRSRDTFFALIENNPFGVYLVDSDFRLRQISLGARKVFSSVHDALGRDFAEVLRLIWPEPFATEAIGIFRHTLETGEPHVSTNTIERRADIGETEAYDWRTERITLPDGRFGVVCYFYDLSDRQRWASALARREEQLRLATETAALGVWSWVPEGDVVVWENARQYEIMGLTPADEPINAARFAAEFLHPDDVAEFGRALQRTVRDGAPFTFEGRIRRADGEPRWIEFSGSRIAADADQPSRVIGTMKDNTERRQVEDALRDADRRKDEFLATLAHELRNPLAPMMNSLELLRHADDNPQLRERARLMMERQGRHMVRLIDDLLDVSRITQNRLELRKEDLDFGHVVRDAVEPFREIAGRGGIALSVRLPDAPIRLHADPVRVSQIVGNLLSNACKFTPRGGRIDVNVERDGSQAVLRVRDTGIGIPPAMLGAVFDMFTQVDTSLERSTGGLGIGLSLVKSLVGMHGGTVEARSDGPGTGSEFVVRVPVPA